MRQPPVFVQSALTSCRRGDKSFGRVWLILDAFRVAVNARCEAKGVADFVEAMAQCVEPTMARALRTATTTDRTLTEMLTTRPFEQ
jgi:hypothetical protein